MLKHVALCFGLTIALAAGVNVAPSPVDAVAAAVTVAATTSTACVTTTIQSTVPTATALAFQQYSYCDGTLTASAYINNTDYNKLVNLAYSYTSGQSSYNAELSFGYSSQLPNSDIQIWSGSMDIANLAELLYIVYNATDVGLNYYEALNIAVPKSTTPTKTCVTHTYQSTVPTGTALAFQAYSYCAGTLYTSVYINNTDYDKLVYLYYTNKAGKSTPLSVISLGYVQSIAGTNYELWAAKTANIQYDGISTLLNITYAATDVGAFDYQILNIPVVASGAKPPSVASPVPYASPTGLSSDITNFLAAKTNSQAGICKKRMFNNIQVTNAAPGTIVAAQSYANPDYGYNWVRDSSLTMDVVQTFYAAATTAKMKSTYMTLFFNYSIARATEQNDPNLQTGLGEPKFNLDNSIYTGPWGRPQNDGPATAAITLIEFANSYLDAGGATSVVIQNIYNSRMSPSLAPVMKDLLFVATNWSLPSFDLWEEEEGDHFYTRMVQYRALTMGATFATRLGDSATATTLSTAAKALGATLSDFWDPIRGLLLYEYGPVLHGKSSYKDTAVILGLLHGYNSIYSFNNDKALASAYQISTSFLTIYPIAANQTDKAGRPLGIPVGRYPEDVYNGVSTSSVGNPWFLCIAAFSEFFYRSALAFVSAGKIKVTATSLPFWTYYSAQTPVSKGTTYAAGSTEFNSMIASLAGWGDAYMRTIKFYTPANGHLSEEIDRISGASVGAIDLTWSYASVLTAAFARAQLAGQTGYLETMAGLAGAPNATGVYGG